MELCRFAVQISDLILALWFQGSKLDFPPNLKRSKLKNEFDKKEVIDRDSILVSNFLLTWTVLEPTDLLTLDIIPALFGAHQCMCTIWHLAWVEVLKSWGSDQ